MHTLGVSPGFYKFQESLFLATSLSVIFQVLSISLGLLLPSPPRMLERNFALLCISCAYTYFGAGQWEERENQQQGHALSSWDQAPPISEDSSSVLPPPAALPLGTAWGLGCERLKEKGIQKESQWEFPHSLSALGSLFPKPWPRTGGLLLALSVCLHECSVLGFRLCWVPGIHPEEGEMMNYCQVRYFKWYCASQMAW